MLEAVKTKTISEIAKEEIQKEQFEKAKEDLKKKIRALYDAKIIVSNIEREIEFLEKKLNQEVEDVSK